MAKKKIGSQADSVFVDPKQATPKTANAPTASKPRGRPPSDAHYSKTSLAIRSDQMAWLDQLGITIRKNTGIYMSRAELIEGVLDFAERSGADLSNATSGAEITKLLLSRLK